MKKYLLMASLLLSGLCVMSCDDDKKGDDAEITVDPRENACTNEGEKKVECVNDVSRTSVCSKNGDVLSWSVSDEICKTGCDDATGQCKPATSTDECTKETEKADCGANKICDNGKCKDEPKPECTQETEAKDCGTGKICDGGSCVAAQCTETVCDADNKTLKTCTNGRLSTETCDVTCRDKACRDADYCSAAYTEPCLSRTDGKTMCNTTTNTCDTFACTDAKCGAGTTCVLGVCLPDSQDNTQGSTCDVDKFISHCDEDGKLVECYYAEKDDNNNKIYKIRHRACSGGNQCRSYKSGISVATDCVEMKDLCAGQPTKTECDEKYEYYEYAQYSCTKSTNNETISVLIDVDYCDDPYCISCGIYD